MENSPVDGSPLGQTQGTGAGLRVGRRRRRQSLHEQIVGVVRTMILEGRIPPNARIPETALCEEMDISRTPLREALKVLASEGLVELLPHRGAITTVVTVKETRDLFQMMVPLERLVGRLVAENASQETIVELQRLHTRLRDFHDRRRRADYFRLNQQIHWQLARATGNGVLFQTYWTLSNKVKRARYLANLSFARWDESMAEHEGIMEALEQRDAETLSERLGMHMEHTGAEVIAALERIS